MASDLRFSSPRSDSNRRPSDYESVLNPPTRPAQHHRGRSRTGRIPTGAVSYRLVAAPGLPKRLPLSTNVTSPCDGLSTSTIRSRSGARSPASNYRRVIQRRGRRVPSMGGAGRGANPAHRIPATAPTGSASIMPSTSSGPIIAGACTCIRPAPWFLWPASAGGLVRLDPKTPGRIMRPLRRRPTPRENPHCPRPTTPYVDRRRPTARRQLCARTRQGLPLTAAVFSAWRCSFHLARIRS